MEKITERKRGVIVRWKTLLFLAIMWAYLTIFGNIFYAIGAGVIWKTTINFWYSALIAIIVIPVVIVINIIVEKIARTSKNGGKMR